MATASLFPQTKSGANTLSYFNGEKENIFFKNSVFFIVNLHLNMKPNDKLKLMGKTALLSEMLFFNNLKYKIHIGLLYDSSPPLSHQNR